MTHQVTLQVPQEVNVQHSIEATGDVAGPSTPSQLTLTEKSSSTQTQLTQRSQQLVMGTKRGRFLMRQPRIKRESDPSQPPDGEPLSPQYLSVPPVRVERQCSEPLPSHSPPPGNLLTVPGVLVKQHSHPLLPSQMHPKSMSPPLHIHIIPSAAEAAQRAVSPVVVVSDPLSVASHEVPLRADSAATAPPSSLRIRSDELKRSASSPQTGTRSSHCPVVRTGPALGCNYCWNTVDNHGRILRRKTKYHCPECQTNLCIVPCFQEYHERHVSAGQTDPIALTTSVMRVFPKTTSM
jgi:hypothetical protein